MTGEAPRAPQRSLGDREDFPEWMEQVMTALASRSGSDGAASDAPEATERPGEAPRRRRFLRRSER
jgi:hypothetical protein